MRDYALRRINMAFSLSNYGWEAPVCPSSISDIYTNATLLISQAGAHGSNIVVDSAKGQNIVASGATWSNSQPLHGKNTLQFNAGYLRLPDYTNFNLALNEDFCLEFYFRGVGNNHCSLFSRSAGVGQMDSAYMSVAHDYAYDTSGTCYAYGLLSNLGVINLGYALNSRWEHIAFARSNGVIKVFVNGIYLKQTTNNAAVSTVNPLWIGTGGGYDGYPYPNLTGYMAEIRFTKGIPVYTANFAPPGAFISA